MKRLLIIGGAAAILILIVMMGTSFGAKNQPLVFPPAPTPYSLPTLNTWKEITPGSTNSDSVVRILGQPVSAEKSGETTTLLYPSTNPYWKNEVTVTNNSVSFIAEHVFAPAENSLSKLSGPLSEQPTRLYGAGSSGGIYVVVYPASGVAFEANTSRGTVYQIWRFAPTSLAGFLALPQTANYGLSPKDEPEGGL